MPKMMNSHHSKSLEEGNEVVAEISTRMDRNLYNNSSMDVET
jgi:hypothetical protein